MTWSRCIIYSKSEVLHIHDLVHSCSVQFVKKLLRTSYLKYHSSSTEAVWKGVTVLEEEEKNVTVIIIQSSLMLALYKIALLLDIKCTLTSFEYNFYVGSSTYLKTIQKTTFISFGAPYCRGIYNFLGHPEYFLILHT